jgi:2-octaprenyl-6-methoxyphenol hydroxylase
VVQNPDHYDIVVAGGGMIGSSLALALAPLGLRVAVVEPVPRAAARQPSFDERSTALSRSSQRLFQATGVWPGIAAAATPITRIHVSDQGRFGFSHIDAAEQGVEALGYVVINRVLGEVLQAALRDVPALDLLCPARIAAARLGPRQAVVELESSGRDRRTLSCRLLVAADGAASSVRGMAGIAARRTAYGQHGIVGNLLPEKQLHNVAYERFTDRGPLAMLPLAGERAAFVWTVPDHEVSELLALDDDAFLDALQAAFGQRLGRFSRVGRRDAYPLLLSKASRVAAQRTVLVGNAAHGLHPVAAQGFNLGLRDIAALCDCIADARHDGAQFDPGAVALLERYAGWRRSDQRKLLAFTDSLVRLFGDRSAPVKALRDIGMLAFDFVPGLRSTFAKHTMGLAGRLPRLSRGVPLP